MKNHRDFVIQQPRYLGCLAIFLVIASPPLAIFDERFRSPSPSAAPAVPPTCFPAISARVSRPPAVAPALPSAPPHHRSQALPPAPLRAAASSYPARALGGRGARGGSSSHCLHSIQRAGDDDGGATTGRRVGLHIHPTSPCFEGGGETTTWWWRKDGCDGAPPESRQQGRGSFSVTSS
jgi:hypothetical protein